MPSRAWNSSASSTTTPSAGAARGPGHHRDPGRGGPLPGGTARRLTAVDGWDELLAHPSVLHAELTVAPGDVISPVRQSGDRAGYVVVGAPTPEAARETAARLADSVRFRTAPAEQTGALPADTGRALAGR